MNYKDFRIQGGDFQFSAFEESHMDRQDDKKMKEEVLEESIHTLIDLHARLHAEEKYGLIVVLQALDAAGKDEMIDYIFSHLKPQGLLNTPFGKPTDEELKHDYLWRMHKGLPARGQIGILNRSYYEEIISPKVYDLWDDQCLSQEIIDDDIWKKRYRQINDFERYMTENGFPVVKFFFHMSKDVQKERLLERLETPEKNHEFALSDMEDRAHWDDYQKAFEEMLQHTSTDVAPWYVLPADDPWLARKIAVDAMIAILEDINPQFPKFPEDEKEDIEKAHTQLKNE